MGTAMTIKVSQMEGRVPVTVLHVNGDIDASSHQALDDKAAELVDAGATHLLLDLSDVGYMSSAGFRSMHRIHTLLGDGGKEGSSALKLLNPSDEVKRLMKAMGFDTYLQSFTDLRAAIDAF
jgi:anti-anti-sigma factor